MRCLVCTPDIFSHCQEGERKDLGKRLCSVGCLRGLEAPDSLPETWGLTNLRLCSWKEWERVRESEIYSGLD